jgi:hypothetical protein
MTVGSDQARRDSVGKVTCFKQMNDEAYDFLFAMFHQLGDSRVVEQVHKHLRNHADKHTSNGFQAKDGPPALLTNAINVRVGKLDMLLRFYGWRADSFGFRFVRPIHEVLERHSQPHLGGEDCRGR